MTDDDDWDEPELFYGFGTVHDLSDAETPTPRLLGMRSVANGAAWALAGVAKPKPRRRMGFRIPKRPVR